MNEELERGETPEAEGDGAPGQETLKPKRSTFIELYEWLECSVHGIILVLLIFTFVARTSMVSGSSMVPTLHEGDMLITSRLFYTPKQGDIVVATMPFRNNEPIVKRVIALGGQEVNIDFTEGTVYVDGVELEEHYVNSKTNRSYDIEFPIVVPEGELFLLGDNRNASQDSRSSEIGTVDERYIFGKVVFRVFPFEQMGKVE